VFEADSNTAITKGIVALLVSVYTNQTAETILNSPLTFIDRIDLRTHLSSQRSNGLTAMLQKMKAYAAMLA
jgi:cysteine desulfuration protein SufE